ncbi:ImuA family protein [Parafilimonas sp.]|uniref:ImuA family protein n=1 Tax=Parafilimonas sp. TaxID=1969739 RepID=UPI0039E5CFA5
MSKENIIAQLQRDILPLQGLKKLDTDNDIPIGFRGIENAFPNAIFPVGCTHEFLYSSVENRAATNGFIAVLLSKLMQFDGAAIWISASRTLFPAALGRFGVQPDKIIFIDLKNESDVLYAMEECLKCKRIAAVVGETKYIDFKASRRLQLAAEQSRVTGLLVRSHHKTINTTACVSRWHVTALPRELPDGMPGIGFPRWNVELLKVRNGKPGTWQLEYSFNRLKEIKQNIFSLPQEERGRKTG